MSSIAIIQQQNAIHLITDAAHYTADGVVARIGSKIVELPASNCVLSGRGGTYATAMLEWLLCRFTSFDHLVDALHGVMSVVDSLALTLGDSLLDPRHRHIIVTVAGWSEQWQRFGAVAASTYEPGDVADTEGWMTATEGYRQYAPIHMPALGAMPPVDVDFALGRSLERTMDELERIDPVMDGLAIFEAQRLYPAVFMDSVQYLVGGFAELTTITREGITRRVLKEYADKIGKTIQPEGADPVETIWDRVLEWRASHPTWLADHHAERLRIAA